MPTSPIHTSIEVFYYGVLSTVFYRCMVGNNMLPTKDAIIQITTNYRCSSNAWKILFEHKCIMIQNSAMLPIVSS